MSKLTLHPITDADWPEMLADMRGGFAGGLNVYRTMAHHPELMRAWSGLREHVVNRSSLGRQRTEVVILRTGLRLGSSYEWCQHVQRARKYGMPDDRIRSIRGDIANMAAEDAVIAGAVDELFETRRLSSDTTDRLAALVGREGVLDVFATVGFYSTLGYILNTFETPLDDDIAADLEARPLAD